MVTAVVGSPDTAAALWPEQTTTLVASAVRNRDRKLQVLQPPPPPLIKQDQRSPLDTDVVIVLGAVLCLLICAVWVHSVVRCVIRRNRRLEASAATAVAGHGNPTDDISSAVGLDPKTIAVLPVVPAHVTRAGDVSVGEAPHVDAASPDGPGGPGGPVVPVVPVDAVGALTATNTECIVCLQEFEHGEPMKLLPNCGHGFHVECIGVWLMTHSSCPICRHGVLQPPSPAGSSLGSGNSTSFLLASPTMRRIQRELESRSHLHHQQRQRREREELQAQISHMQLLQSPSVSTSRSSSLYSMFVADGRRGGGGILLHLFGDSNNSNPRNG